jgi:hypothetical protein
MADEEDDIIQDDVIEDDFNPSTVDLPGVVAGEAITGVSNSSSSSSEALPPSSQVLTWPSAGSVDVHMLSDGPGAGAAVAQGGYQRAGRSTLDSTLDSIDAVPGFARRRHKNAPPVDLPSTSSSSSSSSSSNSSRPLAGKCDGLANNIGVDSEVDTGPYAKYHAMQQQQLWQQGTGSLPEDHQQQQQQQSLSAEGVPAAGFMVSGWSSLDTLDTLDSIDALPGYGSLPHSTTLGTADNLGSSSGLAGSSGSSGSINTSGPAAAAAAAAAVELGSSTRTNSDIHGVHDGLSSCKGCGEAAEQPPAAAEAAAVPVRSSPYSGSPLVGASAVLGSVLDDVTARAESHEMARSPPSVLPDTYPAHSSFNYVPQVSRKCLNGCITSRPSVDATV